ncbi:Hypothetical Protein FCC1311_029642 [Hondaea fermentalgiana]|uniref:Tyrosine-protein kinase ephrin type A/B receptor-like domain-containing protein n=1 Tax=Hondaea fermentalgiana TaxID=2315210 RepID=A0A2R5GDM0_9STRA|nr:Hypothetical Protein FCC1311_029642 [Hondaea fermentalgiana]|eukprot:GBG26743.1 Hypothetical Protein FCC1311_029642 [Hondaea fermentalgiana]
MLGKLPVAAMLAVAASLVAASRADAECGTRNQAPCANGVCGEALVVYTFTDSSTGENITMCSPCGIYNRLPCTATGEEACAAGLAVDETGVCVSCGTNKRPVCTRDTEEPCELGFYEADGLCYACGTQDADFCQGDNKCLPGYTPKLDGTQECTRCGKLGKPACANPNEAPCGNGLGIDDTGLCHYCGTKGEPGCETSCEPCRTGLTIDQDGLCEYCGSNGRPWCTNQGENICQNGLTPDSDQTCQPCGSNGMPQCGIVGTHIAEVWAYDSDAGQSSEAAGTSLSFKPVTKEQYRVTKEPRAQFSLGGDHASAAYVIRNLQAPTVVDLDFEFTFFDVTYKSICVSPQGQIVFPNAEGNFPGCDLLQSDESITLASHYKRKRISFSFDHSTPMCPEGEYGCVHARAGSLTDGRKFFMVTMLNLDDVPHRDMENAQVQLRIIDDGEIQIYTRWTQSMDGITGISPGYPPLSYDEVNFSGEFCKPGTTPLVDGSCTACGGKDQPICQNSWTDDPCKNNYVEETDQEGAKTGVCVRA